MYGGASKEGGASERRRERPAAGVLPKIREYFWHKQLNHTTINLNQNQQNLNQLAMGNATIYAEECAGPAVHSSRSPFGADLSMLRQPRRNRAVLAAMA